MRTQYQFLIIFLGFLLLQSDSLRGQCCSPGNPAGGIGAAGVMEKNNLKFLTFYKYGYSDTYYGGNIAGSKPIEKNDPTFVAAVKNANYNYAGINFAYGISDKITLESDLGYFINKTQNYIDGILPSQHKGYGLTDLRITTKLLLLKRREWEFMPSLGLRIPLGPTDQKGSDGTFIPTDLQPTTGTTAYLLNILLYKGFLSKHLRFFLDGRAEFNQLTKVSNVNYKYGNTLFVSFIGTYSFSEKWIFIAQFRNENRAKDIKYDVQTKEIFSTGSKKLFFVPQVNYSPNKKNNILLFVDIPVYQYYNGKQLASKYAFGISYSRVFSFLKPKSENNITL